MATVGVKGLRSLWCLEITASNNYKTTSFGHFKDIFSLRVQCIRGFGNYALCKCTFY